MFSSFLGSSFKGSKSPGASNGLSCTAPTIDRDAEIIKDEKDDDLFGVGRGPQVEPKDSPSVERQFSPQEEAKPRAPVASDPKAPEWLLEKVDEYITSHFYTLEARVNKMERQVNDATNGFQSQEKKVEDLLGHIKTLIEMQFAESKKMKARDKENSILSERCKTLQEELGRGFEQKLEKMSEQFSQNEEAFQALSTQMHNEIDEKLRVRDDCIYTFEADLHKMQQSFTSLRMEMKKFHKGQDFKNTSTSIFLIKAIDMKPDERKQTLSKLVEHEEKCRGAVQNAEADLRTLPLDDNTNAEAVGAGKNFLAGMTKRT